MTLPPVCSFWHGPLTYLARLCLASFVEKGHTVRLYAYEPLDGVPPGVTLLDAADILPRDRMFFYKSTRTPAVFADLFRLELMARRLGIWVDADVYCIRPFADLPEYVFGYENHPHWRNGFQAQINQAVFACPPGPLLDRLLDVFETDAIPPGLPWWRTWEVRIRRALGEELPVHHMQFGATGPMPLNHYVKVLGLAAYVQAKDVFYPLDYGEADYLLAAGSSIESSVTPQTLAVHIWNSALTGRHGRALRTPEPGSFFDRELTRLGLAGAS